MVEAEESVGKKCYECGWNKIKYKSENSKNIKHIRAIITLTIMRAQKTSNIKAGGIIDLSIKTYLDILKASYAYVNLISKKPI